MSTSEAFLGGQLAFWLSLVYRSCDQFNTATRARPHPSAEALAISKMGSDDEGLYTMRKMLH